MTTLTELNALREASNMKPLKVWKASKSALADAIKKLLNPNVTMEDVKAGAIPLKAALRASVKVEIAKKSKVEGEVTIISIAQEIGMNPKVARGKLRRYNATHPGSKWTFSTPAEIEAVKAMLQGDKRKK